MNDYATIVRLVNVGLAVISIALLIRKGVLYWTWYHSRTKDFWWVLLCWSMVVVLGSLEVLLKWHTQYRVLFTLFALLLTIKVMLRPNEVEKPTFTKEL